MVRYHIKGIPTGRDPADFPKVQYTEEEEEAADVLLAKTTKEVEAYIADAPKRAIRKAITKIETIPRRIRESLIALGTEDQVIIDEEAAIATERGKL